MAETTKTTKSPSLTRTVTNHFRLNTLSIAVDGNIPQTSPLMVEPSCRERYYRGVVRVVFIVAFRWCASIPTFLKAVDG
jgi:hypothetical protein